MIIVIICKYKNKITIAQFPEKFTPKRFRHFVAVAGLVAEFDLDAHKAVVLGDAVGAGQIQVGQGETSLGLRRANTQFERLCHGLSQWS